MAKSSSFATIVAFAQNAKRNTMQTIIHGIPEHNFFLIAQPCTKLSNIRKELNYDDSIPKVLPKINLRDPRTNAEITTELHDYWKFQFADIKQMNAFSKLAYGLSGEKLQQVLKKRYIEIRESELVYFFLLKKI